MLLSVVEISKTLLYAPSLCSCLKGNTSTNGFISWYSGFSWARYWLRTLKATFKYQNICSSYLCLVWWRIESTLYAYNVFAVSAGVIVGRLILDLHLAERAVFRESVRGFFHFWWLWLGFIWIWGLLSLFWYLRFLSFFVVYNLWFMYICLLFLRVPL